MSHAEDMADAREIAGAGRDDQVRKLADAMWQLLDDMGSDGHCVCGLAKAQARIAYEPFLADDDGANDDLMPLSVARDIVARNQ